MKVLFTLIAVFLALHSFGQKSPEDRVLALSADIFHWEVEKKIDLLEQILNDRFVVVNASGESQDKKQYLALLNSPNFIHDSIHVEQNTVVIVDNTATVVGKGRFVVTSSGHQHALHLSYIEVFTRPNTGARWEILAMHASLLQQ